MDSFLNNVNGYLGYLKEHSGSIIASVCSLVLAGVIAFGNTQRDHGANDTKQAELERRVVVLEADRATRAEVKAVGDSLADLRTELRSRLDRLDSLVLKDLQSHQQH